MRGLTGADLGPEVPNSPGRKGPQVIGKGLLKRPPELPVLIHRALSGLDQGSGGPRSEVRLIVTGGGIVRMRAPLPGKSPVVGAGKRKAEVTSPSACANSDRMFDLA